MTFWRTDTGALFTDFGLPLTRANGTCASAIFDHDEVLVDDGTGQRMEQREVFRYSTATLALTVGEVVTYESTEYVVREVYQEDDGNTSRAVVVPR